MSFLLSRDMLGHKIQINYKGNATFNTKLGALMSIFIQVLVLFQLIQLTIDMVQMNDPTILSYNRPLYIEEIDDLEKINFYDYKFNLGVYFTKKDERSTEATELPADMGRIVRKFKG